MLRCVRMSGFKKIHVAYLLVCRRGKRDENNQNVCVCVAHQTNVRVWFVSDEFYKVPFHWAVTVWTLDIERENVIKLNFGSSIEHTGAYWSIHHSPDTKTKMHLGSHPGGLINRVIWWVQIHRSDPSLSIPWNMYRYEHSHFAYDTKLCTVTCLLVVLAGSLLTFVLAGSVLVHSELADRSHQHRRSWRKQPMPPICQNHCVLANGRHAKKSRHKCISVVCKASEACARYKHIQSHFHPKKKIFRTIPSQTFSSTFSSTTNPVCERRVDLLVCSLPLHQHSCVGFILAFASSIHNKQLSFVVAPRVYGRALGFF